MTELFSPQLEIRHAKNDTLAVQATTYAPNGCYSAGEAELATTEDLHLPLAKGEPNDEIGIPDPVPKQVEEPLLKLHISHIEKSACSQVIRPLRYRTEVDPASEADEVHAITLVEGREMGRASQSIPPIERIPDEPTPLSTEDWMAYIDRQLGTDVEPGLIVTGTVVLPNLGYNTNLVEAEGEARSRLQQFVSKPSLLLDLQIEELEGNYPPVVHPSTVRYETTDWVERPKQVAILEPSGAVTKIVVQEVF